MYQIGQPILVPAVATDDQPGPLVFVVVTKKFDIATQNLQVPPAMQKKTVVNSNQSNYTTENYLHIASMYNNYIKQWVSYSENICNVLGYDVLDHVCLMRDMSCLLKN